MTDKSPKMLLLEHAAELRRSPRLKSPPTAANRSNVGSSGKSGRKKGEIAVMNLSEENRRRSPRFSVASEGTGSTSRDVKVSLNFLSSFFHFFVCILCVI